MSDTFDHQMDAYDSFEAHGYGTAYEGLPMGKNSGYLTLEVCEHIHTEKAILMKTTNGGFWIPKKVLHFDPLNRIWVFSRTERWFKIPKELEAICTRMSRAEILSKYPVKERG